MKGHIPKSKAKTAYGLLGEVKRLILEEPLRYAQNIVQVRGERRIKNEFERVPSCGTVGCVAGWTLALKEPEKKVLKRGPSGLRRAAKILGLDFRTRGIEWGGNAWELFADADQKTYKPTVSGSPQTPTHAKAGAAHIECFRQKYSKQLKAQRV